jgi:tRNA-uridine 2-sulfurtransferase
MSKKVLVAMSGGVDSSVALIKIIEAGYDAIGVTMKLWQYSDTGGNVNMESSCCSIESMTNAKIVCNQFGIPHYTVDFTDIFKKTVIDNFAEEYIAGRTPNPCIRCNTILKWDSLIKQAEIYDCQYIATGHYATIDLNGEFPILRKGSYSKKDQSYVLWGIPKESLKTTLFPLADLTKSEVRDIARKHKLDSAETPESMEICFIPDNDYHRFLRDYKPNEIREIGEGNIVENGEVVGIHSGYMNYTIGQRKGLGLSTPEPRYVKNINPSTNEIEVGQKISLLSNSCTVTDVNWLIETPTFPLKSTVRIRYNSEGVPSIIRMSEGSLEVVFDSPQLAVTPGQSAVFYDGDIVLGGGIIQS